MSIERDVGIIVLTMKTKHLLSFLRDRINASLSLSLPLSLSYISLYIQGNFLINDMPKAVKITTIILFFIRVYYVYMYLYIEDWRYKSRIQSRVRIFKLSSWDYSIYISISELTRKSPRTGITDSKLLLSFLLMKNSKTKNIWNSY